MEIRALLPADDRSAFRSGDFGFDEFLQRYAGQNQFRHHIGMTYVAVVDGRILGYATVSAGQIDADAVPARVRRILPSYPLPILRLGRLAVDVSVRGRGIGKQLLSFVLRLAVKAADEFGCLGVMVDALPDAVGFYEGLGFITTEVFEGRATSRPQPIEMFLSLREIKAALR